MKKVTLTIIICVLMLFFYKASQSCADFKTLKTNDCDFVTIKKRIIFLGIARTKQESEKGLMYIDNLPEDKGMIFLFDEPDYRAFWMNNMKIPLDILFIYKDKIVTIDEDVPFCKNDPCPVYESKYKVDKVLELKAGFCEKYNIKIGDKIKLSPDAFIDTKH